MWRTWIKQQGANKIASELGVSSETVRLWVKQDQNPKDKMKKKLVEMAGGEFGFADFFR